ncbi:predicted protein [Uncinocarpus reesii 1704]|uniref:Uncharacterized protein n=1 Tax=Uncinocarpus reesii (strain UAMH 1704) TaxID=336963 RepID=C4K023_UNCRE|nr:uncharacterized protein UREG_07774 [Uncinocarpus reesii 1704]EEP82909.1 predicted protein [Uncinocarpus reesii 1704]
MAESALAGQNWMLIRGLAGAAISPVRFSEEQTVLSVLAAVRSLSSVASTTGWKGRCGSSVWPLVPEPGVIGERRRRVLRKPQTDRKGLVPLPTRPCAKRTGDGNDIDSQESSAKTRGGGAALRPWANEIRGTRQSWPEGLRATSWEAKEAFGKLLDYLGCFEANGGELELWRISQQRRVEKQDVVREGWLDQRDGIVEKKRTDVEMRAGRLIWRFDGKKRLHSKRSERSVTSHPVLYRWLQYGYTPMCQMTRAGPTLLPWCGVRAGQEWSSANTAMIPERYASADSPRRRLLSSQLVAISLQDSRGVVCVAVLLVGNRHRPTDLCMWMYCRGNNRHHSSNQHGCLLLFFNDPSSVPTPIDKSCVCWALLLNDHSSKKKPDTPLLPAPEQCSISTTPVLSTPALSSLAASTRPTVKWLNTARPHFGAVQPSHTVEAPTGSIHGF